MRTGNDGRSRVELSDIDMREGFRTYRWFWVFFALLVVAWLVSGCGKPPTPPYCPPDPTECG